MGDRTTCTLFIGGLIASKNVERLFEAVSTAFPEEGDEEIMDLLRLGKPSFTYTEVNYANIDARLKEALRQLELDYTWTWESGGEYGPGIELWRASDQAEASYAWIDGDLMLTLAEAEDPVALKRAREWADFENGLELIIFSSNHELLAHVREGRLDADRVQRLIGADTQEGTE